MNLKPLSAALVGAGIAVVGTAGAIDLPKWLKSDTPVAAAPQQLAPPEKVVPPAPLAAVPGQVPNYRAIVKQAAPAVVGITVEGMHKASAEDMPGLPDGMEADPFFKFFRGIPACRACPGRSRAAGRTRRRRSGAWARASSSAPTAWC